MHRRISAQSHKQLLASLLTLIAMLTDAVGQMTLGDRPRETEKPGPGLSLTQIYTEIALRSLGTASDPGVIRKIMDDRLKAEAQDTEAWLCYGIRGWASGLAGDQESASRDIDEAIRLAAEKGLVAVSGGTDFKPVEKAFGSSNVRDYDLLELVLFMKAERLASQGDLRGAAVICETIKKRDWIDPYVRDFHVLCRMGINLQKAGMSKTAMLCLEQALKYWPGEDMRPKNQVNAKSLDWRPINVFDCRQYGRKDAQEAMDILSKEIAAAPQVADLTEETVGKVWDLYYLRGEYKRIVFSDVRAAIQDYSAALEIRPEDAAMRNKRADLWESVGEADKALADYQKLFDSYPRNPGNMRDLALLLISHDKHLNVNRADQLAQKAFALQSNDMSKVVMACVNAETGNFAVANRYMDEVFRLDRDDGGLKDPSLGLLEKFIAIRMGKTFRQVRALQDQPDTLMAYYETAAEAFAGDWKVKGRYGDAPYLVAIWRLRQQNRHDLAGKMICKEAERYKQPLIIMKGVQLSLSEGRFEDASELATKGAELCGKIEDDRTRTSMLIQAAYANGNCRSYEKAIAVGEEALKRLKASDGARIQGSTEAGARKSPLDILIKAEIDALSSAMDSWRKAVQAGKPRPQ